MTDGSMRKLVCKRCGVDFESPKRKGPAPKYCGDSCRSEQALDDERKRNGVVLRTECELCGGDMPKGIDSRARYCSRECKLEVKAQGRRRYREDNRERERISGRNRYRSKAGFTGGRTCAHCQSPIPDDVHAARRYCDDDCYKANRPEWSKSHRENNREQIAEDKRKHYFANKARYREYKKRYRKDNIDKVLDGIEDRRARKAKQFVEHVDRLEVYERDGGKCYMCGTSVDARSFHLDHLIPLIKGGLHETSNTAVSCPPCNLSKHSKIDNRAIQKRGQNMMDSLREALQQK